MLPFDSALFDLLNQSWSSPFLDRLLPPFSSLDVWKPLLVAAVVALSFFGGWRGRRFVVSLIVGLLLGDSIVSRNLKRTVNRPRPRDVHVGTLVRSVPQGSPRILRVFDPPLVERVSQESDPGRRGRSFPSSHVVNLFAAATAAFFWRRWLGLALGGAGLLVAWSRIYTGSHWPSDIPPSILIGVLVGLVSVLSVYRLDRLRRRQTVPPSA